MERVKGIEPSYAAWEAAVLPLNYTREAHALCMSLLFTGKQLQEYVCPSPLHTLDNGDSHVCFAGYRIPSHYTASTLRHTGPGA